MSYWQEALLIVGMMAVTFGVALAYVPVAVLSAIAVPIMLAPQGDLEFNIYNEYLVAGVASIVFVAITRHLLWTIILGMSLFLALRFLL